ncbi:aquaporin [Saprospiraceae bacterium]|jgi:aquaporin Z|nr:aquaporin [Saprospiraceae bacterium]MDC3219753.1 aquaporin [Saprospiraceae bacterium]MDG1433103.1 aquaporin [Saprospiraceae bacterium]
MDKYIIEFIGTYFLMLAICMSVIGGLGTLAPIAIGMTLVGVIYMGGHISKAHYNPAITLAFFICNKIENSDIFGYLTAQIGGAFLATLTAGFLLESYVSLPEIAMMDLSIKIFPALVAEFLGTFILALVILNVAIAKGTSGNTFYGVAIGFTVIGIAYAFGGISGGVFNPAVAVGISMSGLAQWNDIWIFLVANFVGAAAAALVFKVTAEIQS